MTDLIEQGRRLASERDALIAAGANPADLLVPIHPDDVLGYGDHVRINPPGGECSCGHVVPLGRSFIQHVSDALTAEDQP